MTADKIKAVLQRELDRIKISKMKDLIIEELVAPMKRNMGWSYGNEKFVGWDVCRFKREGREGLGLVYCEEGPPLEGKFLLVRFSNPDVGDDSSWFSSLEDIYTEEMYNE